MTRSEPRLIPPIEEEPIFVVSATRCGSTLLQRVLNIEADTVLWGEHFGILAPMFDMMSIVDQHHVAIDRGRDHSDSVTGELIDRDDLSQHINPFGSDDFPDYVRQFIVDLFTRDLAPDARWGFKEVRYQALQLTQLKRLFPAARFVVLVRRPEAQISSAIRAPWLPAPDLSEASGLEALSRTVHNLASAWSRLYASLREFSSQNPSSVITIRYEDITKSSYDWAGVFRSLGLAVPDSSRLDAVLQRRAGSSDGTAKWTSDARISLDRAIAELDYSDELRDIVDHYYATS